MFSKLLITVAVFASTAVFTDAACHLNCNGHGTCGAWDRCSCFRTYDFSGAEDCSQRVCPQGQSRGVNDASPHKYTECASNGLCNRETGECECYEGYTGHACQRSKCKNDCSGHGQCQTLETFQSGYELWDADQTMICNCDPGYEGPACENRKCPTGDDPLSLNAALGGSQVDEKQICTIQDTGPAAITGTFVLSFTDWTGQVHKTRPLTITALSVNSIKEALQEFPNNVLPEVTVELTTDTPGAGLVVFSVEFTHADNAGAQTVIEIDYAAAGHGSQPVSTGLTFTTGVHTNTKCVKEALGASESYEESKVCSGRGRCDQETGLCICHQGFYSNACQYQTALQ